MSDAREPATELFVVGYNVRRCIGAVLRVEARRSPRARIASDHLPLRATVRLPGPLATATRAPAPRRR